MAGRGWGSDQGEDAAIGVSERSLFATPPPTSLPSSLPLVPSPGDHPLQADVSNPVPVAEAGAILRLHRQFRRVSLPRLRHSAAVAADLELDRGIAFLLVPVCLAGGAVGYFSLATEPDFAKPVAVVALAGLCALVSRPWPMTHLCFMAALLCALGFLAGKVETWRAGTQMLGSEISTQVTGRVVSLDQMESGRIRLTIDVTSTARPKLRYMPERVRLSARKIPAETTAGSLISGYAKLLPPTGPVRPNSYDFSFDSYFSGIGGSGFFLGNPRIVTADNDDMPLAARLSSAVENAREAIADHIRGSVGGAEGEIAAALIVGVRAGIPDEINEAMRRTGIYHIISISGLHMALVGAYAGWSDHRAGKTRPPPPKRSLPSFLTRKFLLAMGGLAMTSIIAGSATALFAIWHFQRVSPLSPFANLAVMPIVSLVVMPFAVLSALAMPFGVDGPFLYVMGKGLTAMIVLSAWISERSPIDAVGLISQQSVLLVAIALVIATMATTWLRLLALPFALAGLLTVSDTRAPDVLISEDARLVALPIGGGELAVSRARPNEFTVDNWKRALASETVVVPEVFDKGDGQFDIADSAELPLGAPFYCTAGVCLARHPSGAIIAQVEDRKDAWKACGFAELIVINDATAYDPCHNPLVLVITKRQLARKGSAAVFFDRRSAIMPATVSFAVNRPYRPWHTQRKFSREARGLPPYRNPEKAVTSTDQ